MKPVANHVFPTALRSVDCLAFRSEYSGVPQSASVLSVVNPVTHNRIGPLQGVTTDNGGDMAELHVP